jgi:hypothetical protein
MSWEDVNHQELSYQRIAELHADAERFRQVQASKRARRRSRARLGRLLWPRGTASRANDALGQFFSLLLPSRHDTMGPMRMYYPPLGR